MNEDDHYREVYAHFGLAIYTAQVLEHAVVNALVICDLIPKWRDRFSTQEEWAAEVDRYMDSNFKDTMAKLIISLKKSKSLSNKLENLLSQAVITRNFLVHHFFRERNDFWLTEEGRNRMINELALARNIFKQADDNLERELEDLNNRYGFTQGVIKAAMIEMEREALQ